jgi:hypothetical protein
VEDFIRIISEKHTVYWLTTHCHGGENHAPEYLSKKFPQLVDYFEKIKPTDWGSWKTDAIDFSKDFRWLDDDVYPPERKALEQHNALDKLIVVNLRQNPDQLKDIIKLLSE